MVFKAFADFAQEQVDAGQTKAIADGTARARSEKMRLESFDDPASKAAMLAKGFFKVELPRLARAVLSFVALCVAEKIAGVFFAPLKGKTKLNGEVIARFRAANIPVLLIGGGAASKRTMCDILGVNTLATLRFNVISSAP